jgi:SAM-dependent MidA family methyltransferase
VTELRPGLRREAPTDLSDVGEDAALAERMRAEIRRDGAMTFARFMELALYDPDGGYYRSEDARPGRAGDFVTAPELHPIFGQTLARAVDEAWRVLGEPERFTVREHGAGEGALAVPLLRALPAAVRYAPVEIDERRLARLRDRLGKAGLADRLDDRAPDAPLVGVVLANEVLDALPVHRVRRRGGELRELAV